MGNIKLKTLSKLGYTTDIARSTAINIINKHCKHETEEQILTQLVRIKEQPDEWLSHEHWGKVASCFTEKTIESVFDAYELNADAAPLSVYGGKHIDTTAKQQMQMAMQLPVSVQGALMPDAHAGYGLPVGGVLAANNAVIPYAVGVDIGCRMALTITDAADTFIKRNKHAITEALRAHTHFGMEGGLEQKQAHAVMDDAMFSTTELLRNLKGKAYRQLGSSGSGNHFVELGTIELFDNNSACLPAGNYTAILSHSGSRGLGAAVAMHYTQIAMDVCRLPREAKNLAWLDMNSEAGQEYWLSMTLAGDYAKACHERIHINLCKALGLRQLATIENHHNFAWKEMLNGDEVIVHRKGATPAHAGEMGIIPGSMTTAAYLVKGAGVAAAINSASHGAGRMMSRKRAKESFTVSSLKKELAKAEVTLIGGSVEEAPNAYKDIEQVISAQSQLVTIEGRFMPKVVRMNKE